MGSVFYTEPVSGTEIATDLVGGIEYQTIKLAIGGAGSATLWPGDGTYGGYVDVKRIVPGTGATELGKQEDVAGASGDVGVMVLARRQDTATTLVGTDGDYACLLSDVLGKLHVRQSCATPSQSSVAGSASSVSLLAANTARVGATIYNDSSAILYVKLGATASTTSYTNQLSQDEYYEIPFGYTGAVDGIWASATGNARITELT